MQRTLGPRHEAHLVESPGELVAGLLASLSGVALFNSDQLIRLRFNGIGESKQCYLALRWRSAAPVPPPLVRRRERRVDLTVGRVGLKLIALSRAWVHDFSAVSVQNLGHVSCPP
ncbi:Uncharacterised protein [Mycobacteroides abscessus subsp. abscessus]|nr:Uncharacterised protein [Mycobacteroides abscessus subsp. abscessus]